MSEYIFFMQMEHLFPMAFLAMLVLLAVAMAMSVSWSTTLVETEISNIGWIAKKCVSDIHGP